MHPYNVFHLNKVDSTNSYAKNGYAHGVVLPNTVIVADTQTKGRGQQLTKWHDEFGKNLLFTLVIEPKKIEAQNYFELNRAVSLSILDALPEIRDIKIKWPNDIFVGDKKLCGMLIETSIAGKAIKTAFIGVGLNVNQNNFPVGINATSLYRQKNEAYNRDALLFKILTSVDKRLSQIAHQSINSEYERNLFGLNQLREFEDKNGRFRGEVIGITDEGLLKIKCANENHPRTYFFKEVKWL